MHSLVLTADGKIYSFGCNDEGALGRDSSDEGSDFIPAIVELPGKALKISAGDSHSACLLEDGRVYAWGSFRDSHGSMGLTLEGNKPSPVMVLIDEICCAIASGSDHLVLLTVSGKVFTMGCGEQGQLGRVSLRSASGESRRGKTELLRPGQVILKGRKLGSEIWATSYCTYVREQNVDKIWAFGLNNYKQLLHKKSQDAVFNPVDTKLTNVKQIAGGQHHSIILKDDGTCFVVGRCDYGRLGLGAITEDLFELRQVTALSNKKVVHVSCGEVQSFAITDEGKLYAWGMGSNHQLGTGSEDDATSPVLIESKQTAGKYLLDVDSGGQHSIFLVTDKSRNASENGTESTEIVTTTIGKKKAAAAAEKKEANKVNAVITETLPTTIKDQEAHAIDENHSEQTPSVTTNGSNKDVDEDLAESNDAAPLLNGKAVATKRGRKKT